jgi:hypothetical protein
MVSGSVICNPMVRSGLSEVIGSWKIIDMSRPRISRIASSSRSSSALPSKVTRPAGAAGQPRQQPHDRERRDRFSRARLADDGDHLAGLDMETQPLDRADGPARGLELDMQILDLKQRCRRGPSRPFQGCR